MVYLLFFVVACAVSVLLVPWARRLSRRWGIVAIPGGRRQHFGRIPKLGGIPIFIAYLLTTALIYRLLPPTEAEDARRLQGVILGTIIVFGGGLLDDKFDLPPYAQFAIQIAGALIANWHIVFLERFANPLFGTSLLPQLGAEIVLPTWFAWLVTLIWIVGMMNAVNWLDGLDGLATGVGMIAALAFAWHGLSIGQTTVAALPIMLAGALLGLLIFNFAPARIFLGSAGVYLLGYNLATLAFLAPAKTATALFVLALPLLDGIWRTIDRVRRGNSPLSGDRGHLHFQLLDRGWAVRRIVLLYYAVATTLGLVALFVSTPLIKLLILASLGGGILLLLIWLTK